MNYLSMCVADVTKITIERHEYGVRIKLFGAKNPEWSSQEISIHGVNDFVEVEDLTVEVDPMIVL